MFSPFTFPVFFFPSTCLSIYIVTFIKSLVFNSFPLYPLSKSIKTTVGRDGHRATRSPSATGQPLCLQRNLGSVDLPHPRPSCRTEETTDVTETELSDIIRYKGVNESHPHSHYKGSYSILDKKCSPHPGPVSSLPFRFWFSG